MARIPMVWVLRKRLVDELKNEQPDHKAIEHVHACCDHDHDHKHKNDTHACCGHDHSAQHTHKHEESSHVCCGHDHSHDHTHEHKPDGSQRIVAAMRSAIKDFVDVGVYFSIGIAITALFNTGIAPGAAWLDSIANRQILAPSALMVLAFILSLCSTSDAFIAATLDKFTYGAKLAFLVFGPMLDLKLLFLYQTVLRKNSSFGWLWDFSQRSYSVHIISNGSLINKLSHECEVATNRILCRRPYMGGGASLLLWQWEDCQISRT